MPRPATAALAAAPRAQPTDCGSVIARGPQLTRATSVPERTGIPENLRGIGPCAIFVPAERAIARQPQDPAQTLFPIAGGSLGGPDIDPVPAPKVVGARAADAHVVQPDIACGNGVIHKISHVLVG